MATGTHAPALGDAELQKLLGLMKGADSVELKLTVPEEHQRSALCGARARPAAGGDPPGVLPRHAGADPRQAGTCRAREALAEEGDDSVVKLRPVVPSELPKAIRRSPSFGVELDAWPAASSAPGR